MKIEIFDVDHGQCIVVTGVNGKMMMIDCGSLDRDGRYWWPSIAYFGKRFETLALTNLDEDHVDDFPGMQQRTTWGSIASNPSVGARELSAMKPEMWAGVQGVADWLALPRSPVNTPLDLAGIKVRYYRSEERRVGKECRL